MIDLTAGLTITQVNTSLVGYDAATGAEAADLLRTGGMSTIGRAVTAVLRVSPNGDDSNGLTWATAYTTIQGALDVASTDIDDCTLILISPHTTWYDIYTAGDPTWAGNYILKGTHRMWAPVKNTHGSATSVFKFTGKMSLEDLAIFTQGTVDGVIFTKSGFRIRHCGFNSSGTSGATISIHLDGNSGHIRGGIIEDIHMIGHVDRTTAFYLNDVSDSYFNDINIHAMLKGIQIVHADSVENSFDNIDIGDSALALDLDAGDEQHFNEINFHHNTTNVDDEVGTHIWTNIHGSFPIVITPDNFTGIEVDTGDGANTWSVLQTVYSNGGGAPFRIVASHLDPGTSEWYRIKFTADNGVTYFDDLQFDANKREGSAAPSGTEFIFNKGTVIKAMSKSVSVGVDGLNIWLEIQEI